MISISNQWDDIEFAYIEEKLGKWLDRDIDILGEFLKNYIESGNPYYIEEFRKGVAYLADPDSNLNRELAYIESTRNKKQRLEETRSLEKQIWTAIFGGWGADYWAGAVRKPDGSDIELFDHDVQPLPQDFKLLDYVENKWHQVSLTDLVEAYEWHSKEQSKHCLGHRIDDLDDPDACTSDVLLQTAVFGEVIYG